MGWANARSASMVNNENHVVQKLLESKTDIGMRYSQYINYFFYC